MDACFGNVKFSRGELLFHLHESGFCFFWLVSSCEQWHMAAMLNRTETEITEESCQLWKA